MSVVLVSHDLLWLGKVRAAASKVGVEVHVPQRKTDITQMLLDADTKLILIDLHDPKFDFVETIRLVKGTRWDARMICFGHHVDTASIERANAAGAKDVWPNSQLDRELPELLASAN